MRLLHWARRALLLAMGWIGTAHADTVAVAVASNFTAPMQAIAQAFARDTGHQARLSFGATGKFYAQIHHGAPFEVLLAADAATPAKLAAEGWAVPESRFTYAVGTLVLWSATPGLVDAQGDVLRRGTFRHLAIANPQLAPYGQAAQEVLQQLGLWSTLQPKLVQGESIGQAYQFAASGNAELGLIALSQVLHNGQLREGSTWTVPAALHTPIRQDAIVLQAGRSNPAAHALMDYLQSPAARAIVQAYGYAPGH